MLHPPDHIRLGPVTASEQDQAWSIGSGESQQPRIIEIRGKYGSRFLSCSREDFGIGRAI
jgi:hypothetical protein